MALVLLLLLALAALAEPRPQPQPKPFHTCIHDRVAPTDPPVSVDIVTGGVLDEAQTGERRKRFAARQAYREYGDDAKAAHAPSSIIDHRQATNGSESASSPGPGLDSDGLRSLRVVIDSSGALDDPDRICLPGSTSYFDGRGDPSKTRVECTSDTQAECWRPCTAANTITDAKLSFLRTSIVPAVERYFTLALRARGLPDGTPLKSSVTTCGGFPVPSSLSSEGVQNADVVLVLSVKPTVGTTIAYAAACAFDADTGRPVLGYINWGSNTISPACDGTDKLCTADQNLAAQVAVGVHEASHALGVSSSLFANYIDFDSGVPLSSVGRAVTGERTLTSAEGLKRTVTMVVSPAVVHAARAHFGCDTLEGLELEDQGSAGTAGSHWEKRVMWNEYMTGSSSRVSVYSNLTLALFHDSGWYRANFSHAGHHAWGYLGGCDFATARCSRWTAERGLPGYFCNSTSAIGCTYNREAIGGCQIEQVAASSVDPWFRYLTGDSPGTVAIGVDNLADYCPIYSPFTNGLCTDTSNYVEDQHAFTGQQFASDARCFVANVRSSEVAVSSKEDPSASCFRRACEGPGKLRVKVGRVWYPCPTGGGPITGFVDHRGTITCPDPVQLCPPGTRRVLWPDVLEVTPGVAVSSGGTKLTVFGKFFSLFGTNVLINGQICEELDVESPAVLTCKSPVVEVPPGNDTVSASFLLIDARGRSVYRDDVLTIKVSAAARTAVASAGVLVTAVLAAFVFVIG